MSVLSKWISITDRHSKMYYTQQFSPLGLSSGQHIIILCVSEHEGFTQEQLAAVLHMNKSTVARFTAQLEKNGFLTRKVNPVDKREYHLYTTDKAKGICPQIQQVLHSWNERITEGLSDREIALAEEVLQKITGNAVRYAKESEEKQSNVPNK